ncbi:type IV toxin-antitoxin system AbiEi family antitoxin domain-containing protein [Amorphus sp. MBR-141]
MAFLSLCAILMAMSHRRQPRLKPLLDKVPPGYLVDTRWLRAQGIDAKSIHNYVARGWLERVIRGVYQRPLPDGVRPPSKVPWDSVLLSLQRVMKHDVHLGGVSALELAGHAHYLPLGGTPQVHVYGDVPSWLRRLPSDAMFVVHRRILFGGDRTGIVETDREAWNDGQSVTVWRWPLAAASQERAVLEALDDLTDEASFEALDRIFESLTGLRPKHLMALLAACRSIKVRRLFFVFADRHRHAWRKHLDMDKIDLGAGPRALVAGGKLHPIYHITVPRGFLPPEPAEVDANA